MFFWTQESIRWYRRATEYGDFHKRLAALMIPYIGTGETVCDFGCGLGCLSLELAKSISQITAVDIDENALSVLRERAQEHNIFNIKILRSDCAALPDGLCWDTVVLCFFGRLTENGNLDVYLSHCKKRLIAVVSGSTLSAIAPSGQSRHGKEHVPGVAAFLRKQGIPFQLIETELEFGQPLDSVEDAEKFVRHYTAGCTRQEAQTHAAQKLMQLADGRCYLPNCKKLGIFIIEKQEEKT